MTIATSFYNARLKNIDFFKQLVNLCIDNHLECPISSGEINSEEYETLDKKGKKLLRKCVGMKIIEICYKDYSDSFDEQQKFSYIEISIEAPSSYQGVVYVPKVFTEDDVKNFIHTITWEPVYDLTELDDNLYYYYTDESLEDNYSKEYSFPEGYVE